MTLPSTNLLCDALHRASPDPERPRHLQDAHALRKLLSHLPFGHAVYLRAAEPVTSPLGYGLRPQAWPVRPSRCDHDPGGLPPWPARLRGVRPAMAADRTVRGPLARSPCQDSERGGPISPIGFHRLVQRLGGAAKMPFPIHPHMLRHACGFKLANDGHDTRALQHYLGHKNIQHTVRYTEMSPDRFKDFWR